MCSLRQCFKHHSINLTDGDGSPGSPEEANDEGDDDGMRVWEGKGRVRVGSRPGHLTACALYLIVMQNKTVAGRMKWRLGASMPTALPRPNLVCSLWNSS